jgi:ribonuclease HI
MIEIFTDGACSGNPGPGGWGVLIRSSDEEKELSGFEASTTNNRMELMAVIKGLEVLPSGTEACIYTDSRYVLDGITQWIQQWRHNNWRTSANKPVKNIDLWQQLDALVSQHQLEWQWVRGHDGHVENERVDTLARTAIIKAAVLE